MNAMGHLAHLQVPQRNISSPFYAVNSLYSGQWHPQVQYDTVAVQNSAVCGVITDCRQTSSD